MVDYASVAERALAGIERAGSIMVLTRKNSSPEMSSTTGQFDTPSETEYMVTGIEQSFGNAKQWWPEAEIQGGDRMFLLAASGLDIIPTPGDTLTKANDVMTIVATAIICPGDTDLLYRVLVRP